MRVFPLLTFVVPLIAILPQIAIAQDACDIAAKTSGQTTGKLFLIGSDLVARNLSTSDSLPSRDANARLTLAYVLPTRALPHTGAIVSKISYTSNPIDPKATKATTIRVSRGLYTRACGVRDIRDVLLSLLPFRPAMSAEIPISEYIYYHKTTSDFTQTALYDFHFNYLNVNGACVATDDRHNGNRQQFLYGDKNADNSLVLANLQDALKYAAEAALPSSAANVFKSMKSNQKLKNLITEYARNDQLETQMNIYRPETRCFAIELAAPSAGQTLTLRFSDLEDRDDGTRLHRPERTWKLRPR